MHTSMGFAFPSVCVWLAVTGPLLLIQVAPAGAQTKAGSTVLSIPRADRDPVGVWTGDAFMAVEAHSSESPILHVYSRNGAEIQRVALQIPEARLITVVSGGFARSPDGYLAVAGASYTADDRAANFLAVISPDGAKQNVVRTNPYYMYAVVFASDGTIWTAGRQFLEGKEVIDYPVIQRFDKNGRVLGHGLRRTRLPRHPDPLGESYLVASKDRIGWFSPRAGQYVEFSLDGRELASYKHTFSRVAGVGLCDDNRIWVSVEKTNPAAVVQSVFYSLDRASQTWPGGNVRPFGYVYGCEGTTLAVSSGEGVDWMETR